MHFVFKSKYQPRNQKLLKVIEISAKKLYIKLRNLDIDTLNISNYMKNYFGELLGNLEGNLQKYAFFLSLSLRNYENSLEDFVFIDYGGGSGIFSLLAKEIGIGRVLYNDIYNISCHDAKEIADSIGNTAEEYILGEVPEIIDYLKKNSIFCNALGTYNVIEHIYDIESFFQGLIDLPQKNITFVLGSGANPNNPILKRRITAHHLEHEFTDRKKEYGHKEGYSLKAYSKIRRELIVEFSKDKLNPGEIENLTGLTKGLIKKDIEECVSNYIDSKSLPKSKEDKYPTNTCDPITGNWAERLMDPYDLIKIFTQNNFSSQVIAGVYENRKNLNIKNFISKLNLNIAPLYNPLAKLINSFINFFPQSGLYLAPYYILYAFKN